MSTITSNTTTDDLKRLRAKQIESESKRVLGYPIREEERSEVCRRSFLHENIGNEKVMFVNGMKLDATVVCNNYSF